MFRSPPIAVAQRLSGPDEAPGPLGRDHPDPAVGRSRSAIRPPGAGGCQRHGSRRDAVCHTQSTARQPAATASCSGFAGSRCASPAEQLPCPSAWVLPSLMRCLATPTPPGQQPRRAAPGPRARTSHDRSLAIARRCIRSTRSWRRRGKRRPRRRPEPRRPCPPAGPDSCSCPPTRRPHRSWRLALLAT
jgi:hypothetical protein